MEIDYKQFKKEFMSHLDGYIPTYISVDEECDSEDDCIVDIELIAPFRMADGPSRFFKKYQMCVNEEEIKELFEYLDRAGDVWKKEISGNALMNSIREYSTFEFKEG